MASLFFTNFATDTHPYYDYGDGSHGYPELSYWPYYGTSTSGGWRSSNPKQRMGQGISVYAGEGKGGVKNGLWCADDPLTVMSYDSGVTWHPNSLETLVPTSYIAGGRITFSVRYKTLAFDYDADADYYPDYFILVEAGPSDNSRQLTFELQNDGDEINEDWNLYLTWPKPSGGPGYEQLAVSGNWATWVDDVTWRDFVITYKGSTITDWSVYPTGPTLLSDGWIKVTLNGVTIFDIQNIELCFNPYGRGVDGTGADEANVGRLEYIFFGWSLSGAYDSISFGPLDEWVDVAEFVEQEISASAFIGGIARVRCEIWTRNPGVTVQARLYNQTDSVSVGESIVVSSTTPVDASFIVTLSGGINRYRLQVISDTRNSDLFCVSAGVVA